VTPAPSVARVQVLLTARDRAALEAAKLEEIAGELRAEVGWEVSRRRVPELVLREQPRLPTR